ncbi:UvrD-helicase domain-containing protein [Corynebacterium ulcerans]|uniref:UvrD-helicase domain-containing protein n=1 Tax=Corynebacterium ulcerans TaxID=65058 RepID=UPI000C780B90|nr:ATP-dependent helicase [Corynebacterium ulcerans]PLW01596.1 hypothetical protein BRL54_10150 [Corynebacterium ulcerans]
MTIDLDSLNEEQRRAIEHEGDVLLVACPGSGKTRTLIYKLAAELEKIKTHREFVIALTYTHAAAEEIRDRIEDMGIETDQLWVGTIHSFCLQWIIKPYSIYHPELKNGMTVIDTVDRENLLDEIAKPLGLKNGHYDCKYYATDDDFIVDHQLPEQKRTIVDQIVIEYHRRLRSMGKIDFEMMLKYSSDLIRDHQPLAPRLASMIRLIGIDEYQDTRDIQYRIVARILRSGEGTSLFLVGDPNQSIFSSLGGVAYSREELEKLTDRPVAKFDLIKNYRSSSQIVEYFSEFAVEPIVIQAAGELANWQGDLVHDSSIHRNDLVVYISKIINYNIRHLGISTSGICIVAPWWIHLSSLTRSLVESLHEYDFNGPGLSPFGENRDNFWYKVARLALTDPSPDLYIRRRRWAKEVLDLLIESGEISQDTEIRDVLKSVNEITIDSSLGDEYLYQFFSLFLKKLDVNLNPNGEIFQQGQSFKLRMKRRLERICNEEGVDLNQVEVFRKVFRPSSGITISTIHGIKGKEFETVIAFGLLEGIVPHFTDPPHLQVDNAKKMLFVTGSRAKKNLYLLSERGRGRVRYPKSPTNVLAAVDAAYTATSVEESIPVV